MSSHCDGTIRCVVHIVGKNKNEVHKRDRQRSGRLTMECVINAVTCLVRIGARQNLKSCCHRCEPRAVCCSNDYEVEAVRNRPMQFKKLPYSHCIVALALSEFHTHIDLHVRHT